VADVRSGYTRITSESSRDGRVRLSTLGFPKRWRTRSCFASSRSSPSAPTLHDTNTANPYFDYVGVHSVLASVSARRAGICCGGPRLPDTLTTSVNPPARGVFSFTGGWMNGPLDNSATPAIVASSMGGLLLGLPPRLRELECLSAGVVKITGLYIQDDWKVGPGWRSISACATSTRARRSSASTGPCAVSISTCRARWRRRPAPLTHEPDSGPARQPIPGEGRVDLSRSDGQPKTLYEAPKRNFMPRIDSSTPSRPARWCAAAMGSSSTSSA